MTDEEKKAIERIEDVFYQDLGKGINKIQKITLYEDSITDIRTVLNLIEKQSKIIQAMANDIYIEIVKSDGSHFATVEEVVEYFEQQVSKTWNKIVQ